MRGFRISAGVALILALGVLPTAVLLAQQNGRESYREAYRIWREAEPDLERAAAATGDPLEARAARAATEAATFGAVREAFLRQLAASRKQKLLPFPSDLPAALADFAPAKDWLQIMDTAASVVTTSVNTFADDTDPGLQRLHQALKKEQDAIESVNAALAQRQKMLENLAGTEDRVEEARTKTLGEYQSLAGAIEDSATMVAKETAVWPTYYSTLAENARGVRRAPAAASASGTASITPLPLVRYTGVWVYPTVNGFFHGPEPEFVDLAVHEENGRASGTFYAHFKLPRGSTDDPQVRFDFSGEFTPTRDQSFTILSTDGAKGTIQLIPGNAFNLLEINFQMDQVPGKIPAADLLLVKK